MSNIKKITYSTPQWYLGRNGTPQTIGLELMSVGAYSGNNYVALTPLNKKDGSPGRCQINVPVDSIPELIASLQALLSENDSRSKVPA